LNSQSNIDTLIIEVQKGNKASQSRLYSLYKDSIYTLIKRIVKNDSDAEHVLQDTFIQVFKTIHTFEGSSSIYSWMRTIAIRTALKSLKNLQNEIINWNTEITDRTQLYEIEAPQSEDPEELNLAFMKLSPGYRTILTLYYIEDFSHREISEQLQISQGTSKSQLHYAKIKLKEILENGRK
jgi:RNA polymerase sigma factor (sigma-70 family)